MGQRPSQCKYSKNRKGEKDVLIGIRMITLVSPINRVLYSPSIKTSEDGFLISGILYDVSHNYLNINVYKEITRLSENIK